jgi:hypothetical protein
MDETKLAEAIVNALNAADNNRAEAAKTAEEIRARQKNVDSLMKFTKDLKESSSASKVLGNILKEQRQEYKKVEEQLEDLAQQYERAKTWEERKIILDREREVKRSQAASMFTTALTNAGVGVIKFGRDLGNTLAMAGGQLVRGLQQNTNSIALSANLLGAGVTAANSAAQMVAGGLTGLGTAAMVAGGRLKILGVGLTAIGTVLGFAAAKTSQLAKFGIEVLSVELEKTIAGFRATTNAGALFSDGLTGMRLAAGAAGLTVSQFANVLSVHSEDLARLGMGVTRGAIKMGEVLRSGGDTMKRQLLNLGYGFEEQAGLVAETMAKMRGFGGPLGATNQEIVQQTTKYAENLRLISAITGEDAKKKTEQVRQQNQILAFQQYLNTKTPEQRAQIDAAMVTMSEAEKKNLRDRAIYGTVINKEGAILEATVKGLRSKGEEQFRMMDRNELTVESNALLNAKHGEEINNSTMSHRDLAIAGYHVGGVLGNVASAMLDLSTQAVTYTKDAYQAAKDAVDKQKVTTDELTVNLRSATIAAQELALKLQKLVDPFLKMYADITAKMLTQIDATFEKMRQEVTAIANGEKEIPGKSAMGKVGDAAGEGATVGAITGAVAGAVMTGMAAGVAGGPLGMVLGGLLGAAVGGFSGGTVGAAGFGGVEAIKQWFDSREGKASGGIARGPRSGFIEKLHGTEAVVPLPDGKTIPVKLDLAIPEFGGQSAKLDPAAMQPINDMYDKILDSSFILKDVLHSSADQFKLALESSNSPSLSAKFTNLADMFVGSLLAKLPTNDLGMSNAFEDANTRTLQALDQLANNNRVPTEIDIKTLQALDQLANKTAAPIEINTNQFAQSVAALLKGNTSTEKMDDRMATLLNVSSRLQQTQDNTDTDFSINEATGQMFNTDLLKAQWSELIDDLKSKNTQIATSSITQTTAQAPVNSREIADMLGQTIAQSNEALRGVLEQHTDILRSNMNRLDDLVSAVDTGTSVNRRMYYEST